MALVANLSTAAKAAIAGAARPFSLLTRVDGSISAAEAYEPHRLHPQLFEPESWDVEGHDVTEWLDPAFLTLPEPCSALLCMARSTVSHLCAVLTSPHHGSDPNRDRPQHGGGTQGESEGCGEGAMGTNPSHSHGWRFI